MKWPPDEFVVHPLRIQQCLTENERAILAMEYGKKRLSIDEINSEYRVTPKQLEDIKRRCVRKIRNRIIQEASREMITFLRWFANRKSLKLLECLIENPEDLKRLKALFIPRSSDPKKADVLKWLKEDGAQYQKLVSVLNEFRFVISLAQNLEFGILQDLGADKWPLVEGYFLDTLSAEDLWSIETKSELSRDWGDDFKMQVAILALIRLDSLLEREPMIDVRD